MKKLFYAFFFLLPQVLEALPVGNPIDINLKERCSEYSFFLDYSVGFYGDYVFNRKLETEQGKDIDRTRLFTNVGYLAVNFFDRVAIFSTLGVSHLCVNTSLGAFNHLDPHPLFEIETGSAFSYSIGGKGILFCHKKISLGMTGQY